MYSKIKLIFFLVIISSQFLVGQLYKPTDEDATRLGTTLSDLQSGRKLYVTKCSSCHNLYQPSKFNYEKWRLSLIKMQKNAKISDAEKELILKYISIGCKP